MSVLFSVRGQALEQHSRLKALHKRWHEKRNLVVPTCTFCQLPTVKNVKEPPQVKSPSSFLKDQHELELKQIEEQGKRNDFKDRVWKAALAGLSSSEACQLLRMDLQALLPIVKQDFGTEWEGLLELARITTRCDLSSAAIKGARNGDTRLLIRLMDEGFFASINGVGTSGEVSFSNGLRQMSLEQLKAKRLELAQVVDRSTTFENSVFIKNYNGTLEIRESTDEDQAAYTAQKAIASTPAEVEASKPPEEDPTIRAAREEQLALAEIERVLG